MTSRQNAHRTHALPPSDGEARHREDIANAAWTVLRREGLRRTPGGDGYAFRYGGRAYVLRRPDAADGRAARAWVVKPADAPDSRPFGSGLAWPGRTRKDAVVAMARYAYGRPCPHRYTTGRDTCPNCEAYGES
ncbi:hypothetical protein GCM10020000_87930 [Streptomyces olivoverticillatus]